MNFIAAVYCSGRSCLPKWLPKHAEFVAEVVVFAPQQKRLYTTRGCSTQTHYPHIQIQKEPWSSGQRICLLISILLVDPGSNPSLGKIDSDLINLFIKFTSLCICLPDISGFGGIMIQFTDSLFLCLSVCLSVYLCVCVRALRGYTQSSQAGIHKLFLPV